MTERVIDQWAGYDIGADHDWHVEHGYLGGTDKKVGPGVAVRTWVAGTARLVGDALKSVEVTTPSGRVFGYRENRATVGTFPRTVEVGDIVATTGLVRGGITRWPHTDYAPRRGAARTDVMAQRTPALPVNARQIGTGGAKRREEPTTIGDNYDPSENYAPGEWVAWDGFVRSELPGGQPGGDRIWLVKDRLYTAWTTTVPVPGAGALAGIPDLGTYMRPAPPVVEPEPEPPVIEPEPPVEPTPEPEPPVIEPEPVPEPPVDPVEPPVEPEPGKPKSLIAAIIAGVILALIALGSAIAGLFQ